MGHAVLPWESFLSIPNRCLSSGLCLGTSKVEAPAGRRPRCWTAVAAGKAHEAPRMVSSAGRAQ